MRSVSYNAARAPKHRPPHSEAARTVLAPRTRVPGVRQQTGFNSPFVMFRNLKADHVTEATVLLRSLARAFGEIHSSGNACMGEHRKIAWHIYSSSFRVRIFVLTLRGAAAHTLVLMCSCGDACGWCSGRQLSCWLKVHGTCTVAFSTWTQSHVLSISDLIFTAAWASAASLASPAQAIQVGGARASSLQPCTSSSATAFGSRASSSDTTVASTQARLEMASATSSATMAAASSALGLQ